MLKDIKTMRKIFDSLDKSKQLREAKRFMELVQYRKPILVAPIEDPTAEQTFYSIGDVVEYFFELGHTRAESSNISRVLNGKNNSAYKHYIWYGD